MLHHLRVGSSYNQHELLFVCGLWDNMVQKSGGRWACSWWSNNSCRHYHLPGVALTVAQHEHWAPDGTSLPAHRPRLTYLQHHVRLCVCACVLSSAILQWQNEDIPVITTSWATLILAIKLWISLTLELVYIGCMSMNRNKECYCPEKRKHKSESIVSHFVCLEEHFAFCF